MESGNFSGFDNYTVLADNANLKFGYEAFLNFKLLVAFLNQIALKEGDTFLHNGTIYKKKITSSEAKSLLDGFFLKRCDKSKLKIVANQLKIKI